MGSTAGKTILITGLVLLKIGAAGGYEGLDANLSTDMIVAPFKLAAVMYYIRDVTNDEPPSVDSLI